MPETRKETAVQPMTRDAITPKDSSEGGGPRRSHDRLITRDIALIMAGTFFYMTSSMMGTPIIAGFSQSLGANGAIMGFIAGALSLSSLVCRPIAGNLSDRTSKRRLAILGASLFLIANLWYYFVPNTGWLLAVIIRSPTPKRSIWAPWISRSRMIYSSRELEAEILHSVQPASSSIFRAFWVR